MNIIDRIFRYLGYKRIVTKVIDTHGVKATSDHLSHGLKYASKAYAPPTEYTDIEGCSIEYEPSLCDEDLKECYIHKLESYTGPKRCHLDC